MKGDGTVHTMDNSSNTNINNMDEKPATNEHEPFKLPCSNIYINCNMAELVLSYVINLAISIIVIVIITVITVKLMFPPIVAYAAEIVQNEQETTSQDEQNIVENEQMPELPPEPEPEQQPEQQPSEEEQKKEKPEPIMPEILYDMLAIIREIGTEEPVNPLIKGCGYITGTEARLGEITLYVPLETKKNFWGVDKDGYLMNVTGTSKRIYLKEAYRQRATAEAFNYPYYEDGNKEYYMKLTPTQSNCTINTEFPLRNTWEELTPLIILAGMGVIILTRFTKR